MTSPDQVSATGSERYEKLLDFEIAQIEARQVHQGWTPWALSAAVGAAIWLWLDEAEGLSRTQLMESLLSAAGLIFLWHFVCKVGERFEDEGKSERGARFHLSNKLLAGSRTVLAFALVKFTFAGYVLIQGFHSKYTSLVLLNWVVVGVYVGGHILALWFSYLRIPLTNKRPHNNLRIFRVVLFLLVFANAVSICANLYHAFNEDTSLQMIKASLLAATCFELIEMLLGAKTHEPLLSSLLNLKRDYLLKRIDDSAFERDYELLVLGAKVTQVLQIEMRDLLAGLGRARDSADSAIKCHDMAADILAKPLSSLCAEDGKRIKLLMEQSQKELDLIPTHYRAVERHTESFRGKAALMYFSDPGCEKELEEIQKHMLNVNQEIQELLVVLNKRRQEIIAKLQALPAEVQRRLVGDTAGQAAN